MKIKMINLYIAKNFLIRFFQVFIGFSLLIFFINFIDALERAKNVHTPIYSSIAVAFLEIPDFLNDIAPSMVLIAAIISFFTLSSKSEISIIRISGFSLWQVLQPIAISAFLLGIFWITIFDSISVLALKKFNYIESKRSEKALFIEEEKLKNDPEKLKKLSKKSASNLKLKSEKDYYETVEPENGIWIKQENLENLGEEIIIRAKKAYRKNSELIEVNFWFFDSNNSFYKKADASLAKLEDGKWILEDVIINENNDILNKEIPEMTIKTDLTSDFVMNKIVNNFQNVKVFSLFELPNLIKDLSDSGFASTKFKVYFNSLLSRPFLFAAMTLIACFFGLNHIRNQNTILLLFLGIIIGLGFYITSSIINALGSSGLIPVFASTWIIVIICLAIGILLIYRKEHI
jgi:lipopolysaccharide export system permease protein